MISINKVEVLTDALRSLARTHHVTRLYSEHPDLHRGKFFQHCPASSCTAAFNALYTVGFFKPKNLDTRLRVQEKWILTLEKKQYKQEYPESWQCINCHKYNQIDAEFDNNKCVWCSAVRTVTTI